MKFTWSVYLLRGFPTPPSFPAPPSHFSSACPGKIVMHGIHFTCRRSTTSMCGVEDNQSALAAKLRFDLILGMSLATLGAALEATREAALGATLGAALSRLPHDKRLVSATSCQPVLAEMKLPFSALSLSLSLPLSLSVFWAKVSYFGAASPRRRQLCLAGK